MDYFRAYDDRELFEYQYEQYDTYVSLGGLARAEYFAVLDRYMFEDYFFDSLGSRCIHKFSRVVGPRYTHIGNLIMDDLTTVAQNCRLTHFEAEMLGEKIAELGLSFKTDTSAWREYRRDKREYFRLLPLETLYPHFAERVRQHYGQHTTPPALRM